MRWNLPGRLVLHEAAHRARLELDELRRHNVLVTVLEAQAVRFTCRGRHFAGPRFRNLRMQPCSKFPGMRTVEAQLVERPGARAIWMVCLVWNNMIAKVAVRFPQVRSAGAPRAPTPGGWSFVLSLGAAMKLPADLAFGGRRTDSCLIMSDPMEGPEKRQW